MKKVFDENGIKPCLNLDGSDCADCQKLSGEIERREIEGQGKVIIFVRCENRKMHQLPQTKERDDENKNLGQR